MSAAAFPLRGFPQTCLRVALQTVLPQRRGVCVDPNFDMSFAIAMGERFGRPAEGWPASTRYVHPDLGIIARSIGPERAGSFLEVVRQAYRREQEIARVGGYHFGFAACLSTELGDASITAWSSAGGSVLSRFRHQEIAAFHTQHSWVADD